MIGIARCKLNPSITYDGFDRLFSSFVMLFVYDIEDQTYLAIDEPRER